MDLENNQFFKEMNRDDLNLHTLTTATLVFCTTQTLTKLNWTAFTEYESWLNPPHRLGKFWEITQFHTPKLKLLL